MIKVYQKKNHPDPVEVVFFLPTPAPSVKAKGA